ncbi:hypothetical protein ACP70R_037229 [Stipagrostis hirtigluma subsp. patula]
MPSVSCWVLRADHERGWDLDARFFDFYILEDKLIIVATISSIHGVPSLMIKLCINQAAAATIIFREFEEDARLPAIRCRERRFISTFYLDPYPFGQALDYGNAQIAVYKNGVRDPVANPTAAPAALIGYPKITRK